MDLGKIIVGHRVSHGAQWRRVRYLAIFHVCIESQPSPRLCPGGRERRETHGTKAGGWKDRGMTYPFCENTVRHGYELFMQWRRVLASKTRARRPIWPWKKGRRDVSPMRVHIICTCFGDVCIFVKGNIR